MPDQDQAPMTLWATSSVALWEQRYSSPTWGLIQTLSYGQLLHISMLEMWHHCLPILCQCNVVVAAYVLCIIIGWLL
jgi:hypothetical protein